MSQDKPMSSSDSEPDTTPTWESLLSSTVELYQKLTFLNAALANKLSYPADLGADGASSSALLRWARMAQLCDFQMRTLNAQYSFIEELTHKFSDTGQTRVIS